LARHRKAGHGLAAPDWRRLAIMAWMLGRDHTPITIPAKRQEEPAAS
jgi:hypothetical protein